MRNFRVGTNEYDVMLLLLGGFMIVPFIFIGMRSGNGYVAFMAILYSLMILGISSAIILFVARKSYALKGEIASGIIKDKEKYKGARYFYVSYTDQFGIEASFKQQVSEELYNKLTVGNKITIHVNGKYGALNEEEVFNDLKKEKMEFVRVKETNMFLCEYCDREYDKKLHNCPYCGALREL